MAQAGVPEARVKVRPGLGTFERFLSLWVLGCMALGLAIGLVAPGIPASLSRLEYAHVSIPVAILIWLMIYPMMVQIDFGSIVRVTKRPKGLIVTWVVNWVIKPATMLGLAYLFLSGIFRSLIDPALAKQYIAGAVLLGAAPHCNGLRLELPR